MPRISSAFRVRDVEPDDLAWHIADEATRRKFWRKVVEVTLRVKDDSLSKGLDRHGLKMKRVSPFTRKHRQSDMGPADPNAPPLTPAHGLSRTRAFIRGRALKDCAEFYWTNGWGRILYFHKVGAKNHWAKSGRLPVRDVIGLSQADTNRVTREVRKWWKDTTRPPIKPKTPLPVPQTIAPVAPRPPKPEPRPIAALPAPRKPLQLPAPLVIPEVIPARGKPRTKPTLARRAGLFVRRSLDFLKGLFSRKGRDRDV